jgi:hypothetical protein
MKKKTWGKKRKKVFILLRIKFFIKVFLQVFVKLNVKSGTYTNNTKGNESIRNWGKF